MARRLATSRRQLQRAFAEAGATSFRTHVAKVRMRRALDEYYVAGIKTTVPFHAAIMRSGAFREGKYDTGFVERMMSSEAFELKPPPVRLHE